MSLYGNTDFVKFIDGDVDESESHALNVPERPAAVARAEHCALPPAIPPRFPSLYRVLVRKAYLGLVGARVAISSFSCACSSVRLAVGPAVGLRAPPDPRDQQALEAPSAQ